MDLPTCPACHQSVLDEDAAECPFCGAAMKGGGAPARAPAPPRKAPTKTTPPPRGGTPPPDVPAPAEKARPAAKPARAAEAKAADDDPFAVDQAAAGKAVAVSPKPAPGKTLEVKCPMCETPGFVSPKAAGQQAKCCNPKCLVPIFTVPAPKVEAPPPPPPPKKAPVGLYAGLIAAVVLVGGGVVWFLMGPEPVSQPIVTNPVGSEFNSEITTVETGTKTAAPPDRKDKPAEVRVDPTIGLISQALERLVDASLNVQSNRKAFCRRLTAMAYFDNGALAKGKEQLELLGKLAGGQSAYEGCLPTVALAWKQLATSPDEFAKTVVEAKRLADGLPVRGRYAIESGIATAAILVAAKQPDEARKMLAAHQGSPDFNQLAAALQVVQNDATDDLDATLIGRSLGDWLAPLETSVALILAAHGRWDEAQSWAAQTADRNARAEATLAWAEAYARSQVAADPAADLKRAETAADSLPPAIKARLVARLSDVKRAAGDQATAQKLLEQARQLLTQIQSPSPISLPDVRSVMDAKLPDADELRLAALAAAEIGLVQQQLQPGDSAWSGFQQALRLLRATAPPLGATQLRRSQVEGEGGREADGADAIRDELGKAYRLKGSDEKRRSYSQYRQKLDELHRASLKRFLWQTQLLEAAARAGLLEPVWNEVQVSEARADVSEREPFLSSAVPYVVASGFAAAGDKDRPATIRKAAQAQAKNQSAESKLRVGQILMLDAVDAGKVADALALLPDLPSDSGSLHEWLMRLACRLAKAGKPNDAMQFAQGMAVFQGREDALQLVAAISARKGQTAEVWKKASTGAPTTESAALAAGLVSGLTSLPVK